MPPSNLFFPITIRADNHASTPDEANPWQALWAIVPAQRSTVMLVSLSITTLALCSWIVVHLNIPSVDDKPSTIRSRKAKWIAVNMFFPELPLAKALCELRSALDVMSRMAALVKNYPAAFHVEEYRSMEDIIARKPSVNWRWEVAFEPRLRFLHRLLVLGRLWPRHEDLISENFSDAVQTDLEDADVEGMELSDDIETDPDMEPSLLPVVSTSEEAEIRPWTLAHSHFAKMGGFLGWRDKLTDDRLAAPRGAIERCDLDVIAFENMSSPEEWKGSFLMKESPVSLDEIKEKSRPDWIANAAALCLVSWMVLNAVVRSLKGMPVTQLEIATLAFSAMAASTYFASWYKPKGVMIPAVVQLPPRSDYDVVIKPEVRSPGDAPRVFDTSAMAEEGSSSARSITEQWTKSALVKLGPLAALPDHPTQEQIDARYSPILAGLVHPFTMVLFIATRLVLILLVIATLRSLPEEAHKNTDWSLLVPKFPF
ncbi:hypothetical protein B0H63DRAFT_453500 [Podospora didyma]|uniref:Uncharacterized protein n=1 Tax=Podospora didyma TaxID=330526 RepID=A0AAE0K9I9_9PEZI|nr:hypothetical protein B0H63DRAFT_453500 [Podospora didyma]